MTVSESDPHVISRLEKLKWALTITKDSIEQADVDKRSPLIGQYRALLAEIAEIEGSSGAEAPKEANGLVILQEELAKRRQSGAASSRSASRRLV